MADALVSACNTSAALEARAAAVTHARAVARLPQLMAAVTETQRTLVKDVLGALLAHTG